MPLTLTRLLCLLTLVFSLNTYAQSEKLIFAVDIIRHGDRSPINDLASAPYAWPQGLGQLSPTGMHQEYELGTVMRKRYIEDTHLLPDQYDAQSMYVRSSDFDRTLMSAESLLYGLYPLGSGPNLPESNTAALPSNFQPIPIHTTPIDKDTILVPDNHPEQLKAILKKTVFTTADWKQKEAELQPQFAAWSKLTGTEIKHLYQLIFIGDTLYIRQLYHLPLPNGMSAEDAQTIISAGKWAFTAVFKSDAVGQAGGHNVLVEIVNYFKQASEKPGKLKFVLFSAHDSTILATMSAMHVPLDIPPHYASNLSFGLYEADGKDYRVKITYNGEAVKLPACGGDSCTLTQFKNLILP